MNSMDWKRMRAGFTVQGPYRRRISPFARQAARVALWLAAFFFIGALIGAGF